MSDVGMSGPRAILDAAGYFVTDHGDLFSARSGTMIQLTVGFDADGYPRVTIRMNGRRRWITVHQLVAMTFIGPRPHGCEVRHLNGNPRDNRVENLAWGTHAQNEADRVRHGNLLQGERHGNAKLTSADVWRIRSRAADGELLKDIACDYGITGQAVGQIVRRVGWRHL